MFKISDFLINKEDRKPGIYYLYYRIEGDGVVNNGTSSQKERYSTKTQAVEEHWYDVSSFMQVDKNCIQKPDDIFHSWLSFYYKIYPIKGRGRDIFDIKDLSLDKFEDYLVKFANNTIFNNEIEKTITLRRYQEDGGDFLIDFIKGDQKACLFEATTGYGKTATCYYALQRTDIKTIAIITNRITVKNAWIQDFKNLGMKESGFSIKSTEYTEDNWVLANKRIILAPSRRNPIFKNEKIDLWISDEAHLTDSSENAQKFYANKKVLYVTATGNKFDGKVNSNFYVGISNMAEWISQGIILRSQYVIPTIHLDTKFLDFDFAKLSAYPDSDLAKILDDVVQKSTDEGITENGIIKCQSNCANAYRLYQVAVVAHPEIKWYISADGNNSKSFANNKQVPLGKFAIEEFDEDCKNEPNITHILITTFQGKESYSYYDLYNVFCLCDSSNTENFIQLFGRLTREKKHTHQEKANFYVYSPLLNLYITIQNMYTYECEKRHILYTEEGFDQYVRMFEISVDEIPQEISAVKVLSEIALRGGAPIRSSETWNVICEFFGGNIEKLGVFANGTKQAISNTPTASKKNISSKEQIKQETVINNNEEEAINTKIALQDRAAAKKRFETMVEHLPIYFRMLEYYKNNPDKINVNNQKHFKEIIKGYKYPSTVADLRNFPIFNYLTIVYNFRDNQRIVDLFNALPDEILEWILKKVIAAKETEISELKYATYSPHTKNRVDNGRITKATFDQYFITKIKNKDTNRKILCIRIGIEAVLLLKELGFNNILYYTDIVAEKFIFDYYGIECKYVKQVEGKENWEATIEGLDMQFDLVIMNPPFKEEKVEGTKRSSKNLDTRIWDIVLKKNKTATIYCILSDTSSRSNAHNYTFRETIDKFEGVSIATAIVGYEPGKSAIITPKKENLQRKAEWVEANRIHKPNKCLKDFYKPTTRMNASGKETFGMGWKGVVPENCLVIADLSTTLQFAKPGEILMHKNGKKESNAGMLFDFTGYDIDKVSEYLNTIVSDKYAKYYKDFNNFHVCRGFWECIEIPDEFKIKK